VLGISDQNKGNAWPDNARAVPSEAKHGQGIAFRCIAKQSMGIAKLSSVEQWLGNAPVGAVWHRNGGAK
jgi:hypothetical protein